MATKLHLPEAPGAGFGDDEAAMVRYRAEGTERALALDNRGPIRFTDSGRLHPDIIDSYGRHGFYVFTGVLDAGELAEIEADLADLLDRCPTHPGAEVDRHGRPALGSTETARNVSWAKPLADPLGGTNANNGRHPAKMSEPTPTADAPDHVVHVVSGPLQYSEAFLRLYGHPGLLGVAAGVNGDDFTPFNEVLWIKAPGLAPSVAWHQDPWTHWDSPDFDGFTHGFNFMAQLYGCDAANGLWVVPGSHLAGKVDILAMVEAAGSDRLPDAVPLICAPGDVAITNRQSVHGSFANTSANPRVTLNFGFHKRASVLGVTSGGVHNPISEYTAERISERSRCIAWAIDARAQHYPDDGRYPYQPFAGLEADFRWDDTARAAIRDYNLLDLGI